MSVMEDEEDSSVLSLVPVDLPDSMEVVSAVGNNYDETTAPPHRQTLLGCFQQFLTNETFADVKMISSKSSLRCHRLVLASASSLFSAILKDANDEEDEVCIIIPDLKSVHLVKLIEYVYQVDDGLSNTDQELNEWLKVFNIPSDLHKSPQKKKPAQTSILTEMLKTLPTMKPLELFEKAKTRQRAFLCNYESCSQTFSSPWRLNVHKQHQHHKDEDDVKQIHQCSMCQKVFSTAAYLEQHLCSHNPSRDYECVDCGKQFQSQSTLSQHRQTHRSDVKFTCTVEGCSKVFNTKRYLVQHVKSHERTRTGGGHTCPICQKLLAGKRELTAHMRLHTGEKPFVCNVCGRAFRNRSTRNTHQKMHGGEKNNVCTICTHAFIQRGDLRKHMRSRHTGERPYACTECGKRFARTDYLLKHTRAHKRLEQPPLEEEDDDDEEEDAVNALLSEAILPEGVALDGLESAGEPIELVLHDTTATATATTDVNEEDKMSLKSAGETLGTIYLIHNQPDGS